MWYLSLLPSLREARQNNNNKRYLPRLGGAHRWPSNWKHSALLQGDVATCAASRITTAFPPFAVWKRERSHEILSPPRLQCDPLSVDLVLYRCKNKEVIFFIPGICACMCRLPYYMKIAMLGLLSDIWGPVMGINFIFRE